MGGPEVWSRTRSGIAWHARKQLNRVAPRVLIGPHAANKIPPVLAHNGYTRARELASLTGMSPRDVFLTLYLPGEPVNVIASGEAMTLRPGTSDPTTLVEAFVGGYHLPLDELPDSPVILDLGANIGATLLDYSRRYPDATLLGVELDADNADLARANTSQIGTSCRIEHAGVVATPAPSVVYGGVVQDNHGYRVGRGDRQAPAITISEAIELLGSSMVDLVKMDIEGAEETVLQAGDASKWATSVTRILIEVHRPWTVDACVASVERLGFFAEPDPRRPNVGVIATRNP